MGTVLKCGSLVTVGKTLAKLEWTRLSNPLPPTPRMRPV